MYYCDMGLDGAVISSPHKIKTVGQYVICQGKILPTQLVYKAYTIATPDTDGNLIWYKHRNRSEMALLTEEEQKELMLQILKSEIW